MKSPALDAPEMRPLKRRTDVVGEMRRDEPLDRLALGSHGAAFSGGDAGCDFGQFLSARSRSGHRTQDAAHGSARDER